MRLREKGVWGGVQWGSRRVGGVCVCMKDADRDEYVYFISHTL